MKFTEEKKGSLPQTFAERSPHISLSGRGKLNPGGRGGGGGGMQEAAIRRDTDEHVRSRRKH